MKQIFIAAMLLSLMSTSAVSLAQPEAKVGLDDPMWEGVFKDIDKGYQEELRKKQGTKTESKRLQVAQDLDQLLKEIGENNRKFKQKYKPFNPQPASKKNDSYNKMQEQMKGYQEEEARRRAKEDARQEAYQDQILGRTPTAGDRPHSPSTQSRSSSGTQSRSGASANRSRAEHSDALRAGDVEATQKKTPPVKMCECRGSDKVVWGTFCAPKGYYKDNPPKSDWDSGLVYEPGQFACK